MADEDPFLGLDADFIDSIGESALADDIAEVNSTPLAASPSLGFLLETGEADFSKLDESRDEKKACPCSICGKVFNSLWYLKQHAVKHSAERPFKCKYCQKTYRFRSNLYQHKCPFRDQNGGSRERRRSRNGAAGGLSFSVVSGQRSTAAAAAAVGCSQSPNAESSHSGSSQYGGFVDNQTGSSPWDDHHNTTLLKQTSSTLSASSGRDNRATTAKVAANMDSPQRKTNGETLVLHMPPPPPFSAVSQYEIDQFLEKYKDQLQKCNKCKIYFPSREYLQQHMASHSNDTKLKCLHCSEVFESETAYAAHKTSHTPQIHHICPQCRGKFITRLMLKKHMIRCTVVPVQHSNNWAKVMDSISRSPVATPLSEPAGSSASPMINGNSPSSSFGSVPSTSSTNGSSAAGDLLSSSNSVNRTLKGGAPPPPLSTEQEQHGDHNSADPSNGNVRHDSPVGVQLQHSNVGGATTLHNGDRGSGPYFETKYTAAGVQHYPSSPTALAMEHNGSLYDVTGLSVSSSYFPAMQLPPNLIRPPTIGEKRLFGGGFRSWRRQPINFVGGSIGDSEMIVEDAPFNLTFFQPLSLPTAVYPANNANFVPLSVIRNTRSPFEVPTPVLMDLEFSVTHGPDCFEADLPLESCTELSCPLEPNYCYGVATKAVSAYTKLLLLENTTFRPIQKTEITEEEPKGHFDLNQKQHSECQNPLTSLNAADHHQVLAISSKTISRPKRPMSANITRIAKENLDLPPRPQSAPATSAVIPCFHCTLLFIDVVELKKHNKKEHYVEMPYKCPHCEKRFENWVSMRGHRTIHLPLRPFTCPYCKFSCRLKNKMNKHMKICPNQKQVLNNAMCDDSTRQLPVTLNMNTLCLKHGQCPEGVGKVSVGDEQLYVTLTRNNEQMNALLPSGAFRKNAESTSPTIRNSSCKRLKWACSCDQRKHTSTQSKEKSNNNNTTSTFSPQCSSRAQGAAKSKRKGRLT